MSDIAAVLLAAGKGTRMRSERPKVLHELCGRPLLEYVLRAVREVGLETILPVIGFRAEEVQARFESGDLHWVFQQQRLGTGHALLMTESYLSEHPGQLLVINGDQPLLGSATLMEFIASHDPRRVGVSLLTARLEEPQGYGRVLRDGEGNFAGIVEEVDADEAQRALGEVNAGAYLFSSTRIFEYLKRVRRENRQGECYLTDTLAMYREEGLRVRLHLASDPTVAWGVNSRAELAKVAEEMRRRIVLLHLERGVSVVDPANTYLDWDVTIGQDTVIQPFTVIERGVKIGRHCVVGPFAHLRPGTVLEDGASIGNFVEVKNSTVGVRSKARHLSYLGDTTVGADVNIGAGTITANYDGVRKHRTTIADGASTGSNTVLVAPVQLGKGASTGAGSVVLSNRNVLDDQTVVGVPARPIARKKKAQAGD